MASNYIQEGNVLEFTAPTGGVVKGSPYVIGGQVVIALDTVAQTLPFRGATTGVWAAPKAPSQAWTEGQAVYVDTTNTRFSNVATVGFFRAGVATAAVDSAAGSTIGNVRLSGEVAFAVSATYVQR